MNKKTLGGFFGALAAIAAVIVAHNTGGKPATPPPAWPTPAVLAMWQETCRAVMHEHRNRDITDGELTGCVQVARGGGQVEQLRLWVDALPADPVPAIPMPLRLRVDGRFWATDAGTFRPLFTSALTILAKSPEQRAAVLDEDQALGFNGIRVFAGSLAWAGQTPEQARAVLPTLLDEAAQRGLYVYVVALTDTATGYDIGGHLRAVAEIVAGHNNAVLEIANEIGHPTQSSRVNDPANLRTLAQGIVPSGVVWSLGAILAQDEPIDGRYQGSGGSFVTAHLDRGRDKWNQVRRIREIAALSEAVRVPAMSGEPIGASENAQAGKRENDPAFFFALGVLSRLFEVGTVFHSDDGLNARPLGPRQKACAVAFVAGFRAIGSESRLTFKNATWGDSPIAGADFNRVARAYSGVSGNEGWLVLVGLTGDPALRWGNGWSDRGLVGEMPGIQVRHIGR